MPRRATTHLTLSQIEKMLAERKAEFGILERQRARLQRKLDAVDARIGNRDGNNQSATTTRRGRGQNERSLVATIAGVLTEPGKPMRVCDIVRGVLEAGYRSGTARFRYVVNTTLVRERKRFRQVTRGGVRGDRAG